MQQLNVKDFYDLGKQCEEVGTRLKTVSDKVEKSNIAWPLFLLRHRFQQLLLPPCALLPASQRAVNKAIEAMDALIPSEIDELFSGQLGEVRPWQLSSISQSISDFETILANDMPEMSAYAVSQIGIYRTDDLINHADHQISSSLGALLTEKAKSDIVESGKCLAFRVPTASAFHACRAIETGMDQYYEALSGKPYAVSSGGGNNNWGAKTDALAKLGAAEKITEFLTHIRKQYRNPVTHPEVTVDENEARDLFGAAISAISMMLGATKDLADKRTTPLLPGMAALGADPDQAERDKV